MANDSNIPSEIQVEKGYLKTQYIAPDSEILIDLSNDSFEPILQKSEKNLFTGKFYTGLFSGNSPHSLAGNTLARFTYVKVEPNTTYTVSKSTETSNFRLGTFESEPKIGDTPISHYPADSFSSGYTITTESNANYLVVLPTDNGQGGRAPEWLQIEKGAKATPYEEPYIIKNELVPQVEAMLQKSEKNLFTGEWNIGWFNGNPPYELRGDTLARFTYVKVDPNTTYTVSKSTDTSNFRFGTFESEPKIGDIPISHYPADVYSSGYTLTTDPNANYLVVLATDNGQGGRAPEWLQIEKGSVATHYEAEKVIKRELIPSINIGKEEEEEEEQYILSGELKGFYKATEVFNFENTDNITHSDIYSKFNELTSDHPNYVTKHEKGLVEGDVPLNYYIFKPEDPTSHVGIPRPKVILVSGVHGNEKTPPVALFSFLQRLTKDWRDDEILQFIRKNIELVVIPIVNPSGIDENTRNNLNGVNLNSDYPLREDYSDRELSTQKISEILKEHSDADLLIDYHNFHWLQEYGIYSYAHVGDENMSRVIYNSMLNTSTEWQKEHSFLPQESDAVLTDTRSDVSYSLAKYVDWLGIPSVLLETPRMVGDLSQDRYTDLNIKMSEELLVNCLKAMLKTLNITTT